MVPKFEEFRVYLALIIHHLVAPLVYLISFILKLFYSIRLMHSISYFGFGFKIRFFKVYVESGDNTYVLYLNIWSMSKFIKTNRVYIHHFLPKSYPCASPHTVISSIWRKKLCNVSTYLRMYTGVFLTLYLVAKMKISFLVRGDWLFAALQCKGRFPLVSGGEKGLIWLWCSFHTKQLLYESILGALC